MVNQNTKSQKEKKTKENISESKSEANVEESASKLIWKRALKRTLLSFGVLLLVYYSTNKSDSSTVTLATVQQTITGSPKGQQVECSNDYTIERTKFKGCAPVKCGRIVTDDVVSDEEAVELLDLAKKGFALGGSSGGASILDLHSGALSDKDNFVNLYKLIEKINKNNIFTQSDFNLYKQVKTKIHKAISLQFGVPPHLLYLTHPTFFSRITSLPAKSLHDQYWHVHIDKETYKSFHYTSLLYLSNHNEHFNGGRFVFVGTNNNVTIEPKIGRVSIFTSGSENPHFVEKVTSGTRYALTVSFTCDPQYAIKDPDIHSH